MDTITIRGVQFDFDFLDLEAMDRYEDALASYRDNIAAVNAKEYSRASDKYRAHMRGIEKFMDDVLGQGASAKIFFDCREDVRAHISAVGDMIASVTAQAKDVNDSVNRNTQLHRAQERKVQQVQFQQFAGGKRSGGKKRRH